MKSLFDIFNASRGPLGSTLYLEPIWKVHNLEIPFFKIIISIGKHIFYFDARTLNFFLANCGPCVSNLFPFIFDLFSLCPCVFNLNIQKVDADGSP